MKSLFSTFILVWVIGLPVWAQSKVVGDIISGTKYPGFWVVHMYGSPPQAGELLEAKRDGWPAGKAKATKIVGRLCLVRCTEGKLQPGDVLVPTGKLEMLSKLDQVGTIPAGLEAPRPKETAFQPRSGHYSKIAAMGGGTNASAIQTSRINPVVVNTAPHGVPDLDFERRTGQKPFAADSQGWL